MQIKDLEELKTFVEWAQTKQITRIKLGDVEIDISPLSYIGGIGEGSLTSPEPLPEPIIAKATQDTAEEVKTPPVPPGAEQTWVDNPELEEDEKLLFWST